MCLCVLVYANVSPTRVQVAIWECVVCMLVCLQIVYPGGRRPDPPNRGRCLSVFLDLLYPLLSHLT